MKEKLLRTLRTLVVYVLLAALLYFAFRNAPLKDIWETLKRLQLWQLLTLLMINVFVYIFITLRWWLIIRAEKKISFSPLLAVRVSVFGLSYFTFGPQVGGEPLQVLYLQRKYGMTYTRATSTVIMDKLLEFLANFLLLSVGLMTIIHFGILTRSGSNPMILGALLILILLPPVHITLLYNGRYPVSAVLRIFSNNKVVRFIAASERMAGMFCRRHLSSLIAAIFVSTLAALVMAGEYFCITLFLGLHLSFRQIIAAWTAGWLAFLIPLPGGFGALEASQVFALGVFEISAPLALGVVLLIRTRDLFFGGIGLLLAARRIEK